jgi:hypothetical protein
MSRWTMDSKMLCNTSLCSVSATCLNPVPNQHFWPACQEQPHNDANFAVAVALIKCIDDFNVCFCGQRADSKVLPLIAQRLANDVAAFSNGVADVLSHCWHAVC